MAGARRANRINGDARVAICPVFKPNRAGERGSHFTVNLAFRRARANGAPADQIGNKLAGDHVEKFGGGGDTQLIDLQQQLARQFEAMIYAVTAI